MIHGTQRTTRTTSSSSRRSSPSPSVPLPPHAVAAVAALDVPRRTDAMSSRLQPYTLPSPVRSSLFKNQSDAVPPIDELDALHSELQLLRHKTLERAKKAGDDLKSIEESMRRAKEKAKGKAKAIDRLNRDRGCTSFYLYCPRPYSSARPTCLIGPLTPWCSIMQRLDTREK